MSVLGFDVLQIYKTCYFEYNIFQEIGRENKSLFLTYERHEIEKKGTLVRPGIMLGV